MTEHNRITYFGWFLIILGLSMVVGSMSMIPVFHVIARLRDL